MVIDISLEVHETDTMSFFILIIIGVSSVGQNEDREWNGAQITTQTLPTMYELQLL